MSTIDKIAIRAEEMAAHSWEYGAVSNALLEIYDPALSPFFGSYDSLESVQDGGIKRARGLTYAKRFIRTDQRELIAGEGSAADPASLGTAALLLGKVDKAYYEASVRQADVLLNHTPRYRNGAISHREGYAALWSDFMYMAPPFLALSAFLSRDDGLFKDIVRQCELQRQVLQDSVSKLWLHVIGPEKQDEGLWSTGNGWAACGLVRVFALFQKYDLLRPGRFSDDAKHNLERFIVDILGAAVLCDRDTNGLLRNYLNDELHSGENAGTAAIASAVFRMSSLTPSSVSADQIAWAEEVFELVLANVADDGTLAPVANPMDSHDRLPQCGSAEGQAFALHLIAAHRDWKMGQVNKVIC